MSRAESSDSCLSTTASTFAEAHSSRPPKEMFAGPNVLEVHEILTSTDLDVD
jgi:hypothetical protein